MVTCYTQENLLALVDITPQKKKRLIHYSICVTHVFHIRYHWYVCICMHVSNCSGLYFTVLLSWFVNKEVDNDAIDGNLLHSRKPVSFSRLHTTEKKERLIHYSICVAHVFHVQYHWYVCICMHVSNCSVLYFTVLLSWFVNKEIANDATDGNLLIALVDFTPQKKRKVNSLLYMCGSCISRTVSLACMYMYACVQLQRSLFYSSPFMVCEQRSS